MIRTNVPSTRTTTTLSWRVVAVLLLVASCGFVRRVNGQQGGLLGRYFNRICQTLLAQLPVAPNCECDGSFTVGNGIFFSVDCTLANSLCIGDDPETTYCGTPSFEGKYYRRTINSTTTLAFDADALFSGLVDPPELQVTLVHSAPITFTNPIQFTSCVVKAGDTQCTSCTICAGQQSFKFDCSNIKLFELGNIEIAFPTVETCIGIEEGTTFRPRAPRTLAPRSAPV